MKPVSDLWDQLADLVEYPEEHYADRLDACIGATARSSAAIPLQRFREAMAAGDGATLQQHYVDAFDFDPACALNIGWHLFGDAPGRGAFLSALREDLARAGVYDRGELPDYLPALLRLVARENERSAAELATLVAPAVARVHERLQARGSPFADVIEAVGLMLDVVQRHEDQP